MAPWPHRLNSNNSASNGQIPSIQVDLNRPLPQVPPNAPDYEIPTLRRRPQPGTSNPAPLKHARSFSHPFPSIFGGGKKPDKKAVQRPEANIYDTTDDDASINGDNGRPNGVPKTPSRNPSQKANKEPVTGKCMTCDSTVRWPQGLKVYRCTICLTINDLEPYSEPINGTIGLAVLGPAAVPRKREHCFKIDTMSLD